MQGAPFLILGPHLGRFPEVLVLEARGVRLGGESGIYCWVEPPILKRGHWLDVLLVKL